MTSRRKRRRLLSGSCGCVNSRFLLGGRAHSGESRTEFPDELALTRPSATLSPLSRGEGQHTHIIGFVALFPACGEKVPKGRMRGTIPLPFSPHFSPWVRKSRRTVLLS